MHPQTTQERMSVISGVFVEKCKRDTIIFVKKIVKLSSSFPFSDFHCRNGKKFNSCICMFLVTFQRVSEWGLWLLCIGGFSIT
jgi:hypothetical protein